MPQFPAEPRSFPPAVLQTPVTRVVGRRTEDRGDLVAVEEPLEIRVRWWDGRPGDVNAASTLPVSVTMRTPGHDAELAVGFLFGEGLIASPDDLDGVDACGDPGRPGVAQPAGCSNAVTVRFRPGVPLALDGLRRHSYTTSSCGVCGKTSVEAVRVKCDRPIGPGPAVDPEVIHRLPGVLRSAQPAFDRSGGIHAAALFDPRGDLIALREDVGRHNAVDKLIGSEVLRDRVPLADRILLLSGRVSFELVQKAAVAGVPVVAAIGAPSSLALALAADRGMTILGFVRDGRFNVYTGHARVDGLHPDAPPFAHPVPLPLVSLPVSPASRRP